MDSINTILGSKDFNEPDDITKLKAYIEDRYRSPATIRVHKKGLIISVSSSALANTLHLHLPEIKRELDITQALVVRIG